LIAAVLAVLLATLAAVTLPWFIWPETSSPNRVDAIVVLGGGRGERLDKGLELLRAGVSDTLVLSTGVVRYAELQPVYDLCEFGSDEYQVICVTASPDNTKGEAIDVSAIARERRWTSIALVTTDHHMNRALRWFRRCYAGTIYPVSAPSVSTTGEIIHEALGVAEQLTIDRSCTE
jgi:uncharacterized SAM-binding protein YcdF (DUF218 family)